MAMSNKSKLQYYATYQGHCRLLKAELELIMRAIWIATGSFVGIQHSEDCGGDLEPDFVHLLAACKHPKSCWTILKTVERDQYMAKRKNKEVVNAATTSKLPQSEKKIRKLLKAGAKITKDSSTVKISEPEKIKVDEIKKVKDDAIIIDSTQRNEQKDGDTKETEAITNGVVAGLIFMCNSKTKPDCFHYKVMGLPENRKDFVFRIKPGMRLFLYDFDAKLLYGIFKASSFGGLRLEPAAFNGLYPAQVRFEVDSARSPLPYHIFKNAILDNCTGSRNMFKIELSIEQQSQAVPAFFPLPTVTV
ncbi:hypothetical protein KSP40_PGU021547 [Platanthera guangdongensis]|uniref:DCD domain-containing protein n=1 Tax=Platanthera guangdongensis TaxID=2320717 RepID=A0ABR2LTN3_9ASPA